jgi:rSAM/selenodomain-associated transferase 2
MISVIIPAYNEEQALPATIRSLLAQPGDYEVIVVDGGSTDRTIEVVEEFGFEVRGSRFSGGQTVRNVQQDAGDANVEHRTSNCRRLLVISAPKGRASQMNAGARGSKGEWLLFLHADTRLPEGALARLNRMEGEGGVHAGGFLHQFAGSDWRLRLISFLDNFRCVRSRIIYGDQAMFVRRRLFEELGGFPDQPILEDVAFCEKLVRVTEPILLAPAVVTDPRKFVQMGVWKSLGRVLLIILHTQFNLPILPRVFFSDVR